MPSLSRYAEYFRQHMHEGCRGFHSQNVFISQWRFFFAGDIYSRTEPVIVFWPEEASYAATTPL